MGSTLVRGLFFDLDGTLADTFEALYQSYAQAFRDEGHNFVSRESARSLFPRRFDTWVYEIVPGADAEQRARVAANKARLYKDYIHLIKPNEPLIAFLRAQRPYHKLALVSTARRISGARVIEALGLTSCFDELVFGDEVQHSKPHPDSYQLALAKTGLKAQEVLAFEDSRVGIEAATAAGISVMQVRWSSPTASGVPL